MISFVWPKRTTFVQWAGGSEVYTMEQLRELQRRNIPTRLIACSEKVAKSIASYPDIPMLALKNETELSKLDDTLIFIMDPMNIATKRPAFIVLHVPVKGALYDHTAVFASEGMKTKSPIVTSKYMARYWEEQLGLPKIPVAYPSVDETFSLAPKPLRVNQVPRVLFAGRPIQEKGVYTLLASLHMPPLRNKEFDLTCIKTMNHDGDADVVHALFEAHPRIRTVPARKDRESMAALYAEHDIVVMPTSSVLWREAFGMVSVEAQHAGCRVVASDDGGLPETDCGSLLLVKPDDPLALAEGIARAIDLGPVSKEQRQKAKSKFTAAQSVDSLLSIINLRA